MESADSLDRERNGGWEICLFYSVFLVAGEFAWYVLPWNLLALVWCLVSVQVWRHLMGSCQLMFLGVRSSLESGFGLKSPASSYRSYFYSSFIGKHEILITEPTGKSLIQIVLHNNSLSFLLLIVLYGGTKVCLYNHPVENIWVISIFWQLWIRLWTFVYSFIV